MFKICFNPKDNGDPMNFITTMKLQDKTTLTNFFLFYQLIHISTASISDRGSVEASDDEESPTW